MTTQEIIKSAKIELEIITEKYLWEKHFKNNELNPTKAIKATKKLKKEIVSSKEETKEKSSEIKETNEMKEMKEINEINEINEIKETKETKKVKKATLKTQKTEENKMSVIIIKNPMLNYINENTYKIGCCINYENSLKQKLKNFIEPCDEIYIKPLSNIVNIELLKTITIKNVQNLIMKIFEGDMIIDFRHSYMGSIILSEEELIKKIKKLENEINTIINEYEPVEKLKIEYSKNKKVDEIFENFTKKNIEKILNSFKHLLKTKTKYKLMAYTLDSFNYYGSNIWCVDILRGSSKTPETAITLISEFIPNTKIYEFNNYKESECYESYNLLIFLLIYNNQNTYYNPNNETSLFLKCENIDAMFEKIKELSNIINQPLNTMKYELLKLYPESKQLF